MYNIYQIMQKLYLFKYIDGVDQYRMITSSLLFRFNTVIL